MHKVLFSNTKQFVRSYHTVIEKIGCCLAETNNYYKLNKQDEFRTSLISLKALCLQLNNGNELKLNGQSWNYVIQHFCRNEAFVVDAQYWFKKLMKEKRIVSPNYFTLSEMLKVFSASGDAEACEYILNELEKQGHNLSVFSFIHVISAYIKRKDLNNALEIVEQMTRKGIEPNFGVYIPILKEATLMNNSKIGLSIYGMIKKSNLSSPQLSMTIISFALKVKKPEIVIEECEKMKNNRSMTVISWTCLIQAYLEMNSVKKAINVIEEMKNNGIDPNATTFIILLTACANSRLYEEGKLIHEIAKNTLKHFTIELSNSVLNFYTKCGHPDISIQEGEILRKKKNMNVVTYNCIIQAHLQKNTIKKAINVIEEMKNNGIDPNATTFIILLTACANLRLYEEGKLIHEIAKNTLKHFTIEFYNTIINFYSRYGSDGIIRAISILEEMEINRVNPDTTTFTILLSSCADYELFEQGQIIHEMARKKIPFFSCELHNSVMVFYTKCRYPEIAIDYFTSAQEMKMINTISYNILIQAYLKLNDIKKAINVIEEMKNNGIDPNATTFIILLTACANSRLYEEGKLIHEIAKNTLKHFTIEFSVSVLNFYTKCGHPDISIQEGEILRKKKIMNVAVWNCLIQAYINSTNCQQTSSDEEHGLNKAMEVYTEMKKQSIKPDKITFVILLAACGEYVAADLGKKIIKDIEVDGMNIYEEIISVMVFFYSRIGDRSYSQQLFDNLEKKMEGSVGTLSIITYNNMLTCYAQHGKATEAQRLFNRMVEKKVDLNEKTFTIMLNAFSHCGMVEDAVKLYQDMKPKYHVHSNTITDCVMVDVFSRAGLFEEAEQVIAGRMDVNLWGALMGGCRKYNNVILGEKIFNVLTKIDEKNTSAYILLSHIYKYHGMDEKAEQIRQLMEKRDIKKIPGIVYHEEDGKVFKFISGSTKFENFKETETMRDKIYQKIIGAGFKPDIRWATHARLLTDEEKVASLCRHAEKTAIAHAFVLNPNRKQIILTKNLRVCNDCHSATEYISKVLNVEIIVRDANRYHHFKDGKCSCNGFW